MKKTYTVNLDALKHERDKEGDLYSTMHLELPAGTDLPFLQKAQRWSRHKDRRDMVTFKLRVIDHDSGAKTHNLTSKGSKTKDFKVVAVAQTFFNAHHHFESLMDPADRDSVKLELVVEIQEPITPLFTPPDSDDDRDGGGERKYQA